MPEIDLTSQAEQLLTELPQPISKFSRLSRADEALILHLADDGHSQTEIAQRIPCTQSTVSKVLNDFADTRDLAKRLWNNAAIPITKATIRGIVKAAHKGNPEPGLEALDRQDVAVRHESGGRGVQVNILSAGQLFGMPESREP